MRSLKAVRKWKFLAYLHKVSTIYLPFFSLELFLYIERFVCKLYMLEYIELL